MRGESHSGISLCHSLLLEGGGIVSLVGAGGKTTLLFRLARALAELGEKVLVTTTTHMMPPDGALFSAVILSPDPNRLLEEAEILQASGKPLYVASAQDERGKLVGLKPESVQWLFSSGLFEWVLVEADGAAQRPLKAPAAHEPVIPRETGWVVGVVGLDAIGRPLAEQWVFRHEQYARLCQVLPAEPVTPQSVARLVNHPQGLFKNTPGGALRILWLNKADLPGRVEEARKVAEALMKSQRLEPRRIVVGCARGDNPVSCILDPPLDREAKREGALP